MKYCHLLIALLGSSMLVAQQYAVTFSVDMSGISVSPDGVHVAGDFQSEAGFGGDWQPGATELLDPDGDGIYTRTVSLPDGIYYYKYVNGDEWSDRPELPPAECAIHDGNGNYNRTFQVNGAELDLPVIGFDQCEVAQIDTDYDTHWWNDAVFYEIFVRSFYDSDGDGIGDFRGIIEQLDYLNDGDPDTDDDLGITGIWLMPMMSSPSYHGYDVVDYYATEPDYGTMEDFEALLAAAHARGIRVIIDLVLNHTSDQHPWFSSAKSSTASQYRDWYRWSNSKPSYLGPWGQEVWHQSDSGFYYGLFWGGMPDLNYDHPEVKAEMWRVVDFWQSKGVDGFRLDAIKYLDEDGVVLENTRENFEILESYTDRVKANDIDAFSVGEAWTGTAGVIPYVGDDRLDVCFEFDLGYAIIDGVQRGDASRIRQQMTSVQAGYPALQYATFLTNHDIDRVYTQLSGNDQQMKSAAAIYLTLPGVPFIYYGEELGMTGRGDHENIRRPMQWTDGQYAGFTESTPWTSPGANYTTRNVAAMRQDDSSLLSHYDALIQARLDSEALRKGYLLNVESGDPNVLAYMRVYEDDAALVVHHLGSGDRDFSLSLELSTLISGGYDVRDMISNMSQPDIQINTDGGFSGVKLSLGSGESVIYELQSMTTSTSDPDAINAVARAYPNPSADSIQIEWSTEWSGSVRIEIVDASGQIQLFKAVSASDQKAIFDLSPLKAGLYFVRISDGHHYQTLKLIK